MEEKRYYPYHYSIHSRSFKPPSLIKTCLCIVVDRIKKDLIHKAKVKKAYRKIKAAETNTQPKQTSNTVKAEPQNEEQASDGLSPSQSLATEKQARLNDDDKNDESDEAARQGMNSGDPRTTTLKSGQQESPHRQNKEQPDKRRHNRQQQRRPGYFDKATAEADRRRNEAEKRNMEIDQRNAERMQKIADRERFQRALKKARKPGRDGQRRLGRESGLLLEKVKRLVDNRR